MELHSTNFGARLRALIARKGVSHAQFAADLGISEASLYNWLKLKRPPHEKYWARLANYFEVSESYLSSGTPEKAEDSLEKSQSTAREVISTEEEITRHFASILAQARLEPSRLGWLLEQLRTHLRAPSHWAAASPKSSAEFPLTVPVTPKQIADAKAQLKSTHPKHVKKLIQFTPTDPGS